MIGALVVIALSQADAGAAVVAEADVDVQSHASPRATIDATASTDLLAANSVATDPGSGEPAELTAYELGIRALLNATAISRHLHLDVDYQGRQPIAGNLQNTPIHLLNRAELSADFLDKLLYFGVGRFLAPSAVMLPVDGLRARLAARGFELQLFGGRRAITSTRTGNVELSTFLPAVGLSAAFRTERVEAEAGVSFSRDQVPLQDGEQHSYDQLSAFVRSTVRPFDWVVIGGELALAPGATYVLGPSWSSVELVTRSVDLFYGYALVDLRPHSTVRITYDLHGQRAQLRRDRDNLDPNEAPLLSLVPQFIDNRLRVRWRPFQLGWLGPDARFRVRPDRNELRVGGRIDLAPPWAKGVCLRATYMYEKMLKTGDAALPADRQYWSASLGWRWSGLDLAAGVSNVQRSNLPLSSRRYSPFDDGPATATDLSPFMLEAQRTAFVRAFWGSDVFFAGVDFEQSLTDTRERRVFAQLGARLEREW